MEMYATLLCWTCVVLLTLEKSLVTSKGVLSKIAEDDVPDSKMALRNLENKRLQEEADLIEMAGKINLEDITLGQLNTNGREAVSLLKRKAMPKRKTWKEECKDAKNKKVCLTPGCVMVAGNMLKRMNLKEDPCENFYEFACRGFIDDPEHPFEDYPKITGFEVIRERNIAVMQQVIAKDPFLLNEQESEAVKKAQQQFQGCLSSDDSAGSQPVYDFINELGSWTISSNDELNEWTETGSISIAESLAKAHRAGSKPLFGCEIIQDYKDSSKNRIMCDQNGILLRFSGYYNPAVFPRFRPAIVDTVAKMGLVMDGSDQVSMGEAIADLDFKLGQAFDPDSVRTSILAVYKKVTVQELTDLMGGAINMAEHFSFFVNQEVKPTDEVIIYAKDYFEKLGAILAETPKEVIQNYIVFGTLRTFFRMVPASLHSVRDTFADGVGSDYSTHDKHQCIQSTLTEFPFATAAMFAQDRFKEEDRAEVKSMIDFIEKAFENSMPNLEWLDERTMDAAVNKAKLMVSKIAYPLWMMDVQKLDAYYANVEISGNEFVDKINCKKAAIENNIQLFGTDVDRDRWNAAINPTLAAAFYQDSSNEMVLYGGIFQEPFYGHAYPKALVYGMIGTIIAHEFTHAFDTNGRQFDGTGQLVDWWTPEADAGYRDRTQCFIDQYNNITVNGRQVDGTRTLPENLADNGGLNIAYNAYQLWRKAGGKKEDVTLPGLDMTSDQLFFLGYTQNWCAWVSNFYLNLILAIDVHSPNSVRGEVALMNSKKFAKAYKCPKGSRMNPREKCALWV